MHPWAATRTVRSHATPSGVSTKAAKATGAAIGFGVLQ
jgi:hypothetical protein